MLRCDQGSARLREKSDLELQSRTIKHGLGRNHPKTAAGHGRMMSTSQPRRKRGAGIAEKGSVKMKNFFNSENKVSHVYVFTPTAMAEKTGLTHEFLLYKIDEYEALKAEIDTLQAEVCDDEADCVSKVGQ
jgi:hypothetical protein